MNDSHVALTRCFYCGEASEIILASRYRTKPNGDIEPSINVKEAFHNKVLDRRPCQKCEEWMKEGIILISCRDGETGDNPYRTGSFCVIKKSAAKRFLRSGHPALAARFAFVEDEVWDKIGLPRENIKEAK